MKIALWALNNNILFMALMVVLGILGVVLRKMGNVKLCVVYALVMFVILHAVFSELNKAICVNMGYGYPSHNEELQRVFVREFLNLDSEFIYKLFEFGWDFMLLIAIVSMFVSGVPMCVYAILTGLMIMQSPIILFVGTFLAWIVGVAGAGFLAYFAVVVLVLIITVPEFLIIFFL